MCSFITPKIPEVAVVVDDRSKSVVFAIGELVTSAALKLNAGKSMKSSHLKY